MAIANGGIRLGYWVNKRDRTRLAHLGCQITTLIDNPHLTDAAEAEQEFWRSTSWHQDLQQQLPSMP